MATALAVHKTRQITKISINVSPEEIRWKDLPVEHDNEIPCLVGPFSTSEKMAFQLERISRIVANASEKKGGLLVHGALAERKGVGVILAGPGGVGKTTASIKLPPPWCALSDDNALIVKAADGTYWAHPWPTWSRYREGDMSGSWDVQAAVKLGLICMLSKNKKDHISQLPIRQAISELVDVSGQTFAILANGMSMGALRRINKMRFHNAIAVSKKIPVCRLEISLSGNFWDEIEGFLNAPAKMHKMKG
ncbi:MAG: SynChlorMet cassette protein ScmC [Candidatus Aminicenantes bacterium]|nr:SynChlorMet cassette protein ScmC [Candidatus Aminicenantes bacterium]